MKRGSERTNSIVRTVPTPGSRMHPPELARRLCASLGLENEAKEYPLDSPVARSLIIRTDSTGPYTFTTSRSPSYVYSGGIMPLSISVSVAIDMTRCCDDDGGNVGITIDEFEEEDEKYEEDCDDDEEEEEE